MIKNAKSILLIVISVLMIDVARAESPFYGSVSYGSQSESRNSINNSEHLDTYSSTPHGAGQSIDLMLGLRFGKDKNMFLELSGNKLLLNETISQRGFTRIDACIALEGVVCTPHPCIALVGVICPYSSESKQNSDVENIDLVLGWNIQSKNNWVLQPYFGARYASLGDSQIKEPRIESPVRHYLYELNFDSVGVVAGLKARKNIGHWFYTGEVSASAVSGTRTLRDSITYNEEYRIAWRSDVFLNDEVSVKQWQAKIAFGRHLAISESANLDLSLGYRIGGIKGFDEGDLNANSFFGQRDAFEVRPKGFDLKVAWGF